MVKRSFFEFRRDMIPTPKSLLISVMEKCLDLALRTGGAAGSVAPTQTPSGDKSMLIASKLHLDIQNQC